MYLDLNSRVYLLRRLFFRRASQNVVSPGERPDAPARRVLCAPTTTRREPAPSSLRSESRGAARLARRLSAPARALPDPVLVARAPAADPRRADGRDRLEPDLRRCSSSPPWSSSSASSCSSTSSSPTSSPAPTTTPPASRPCSRSPRSSARTRPSTSTSGSLLTGGEECLQEGMRSFVRAHRSELDRETHLLRQRRHGGSRRRPLRGRRAAGSSPISSIDAWWSSATRSRPPIVRTPTATRREPLDPRSRRRLDARLASRASPRTRSPAIDDVTLRPGGYHPLDDTPDRIDPAALDRAHGFTLELVRALDRDVGRRAAPVI